MNLTELTIKTTLKKMFTDGHFSICTIDKCLKLTNSVADPKVYEHMHALHCVNYKDMPEELRQWLFDETITMFSGNGFDLDMLDFIKQPQPKVLPIRYNYEEPERKQPAKSFIQKLLS